MATAKKRKSTPARRKAAPAKRRATTAKGKATTAKRKAAPSKRKVATAKRKSPDNANARGAAQGDDAVDAYIAAAAEPARERLRELRALVRRLAPAAVEGMAYGMPGYKLGGRPLVYFAAFPRHIGLYALPSGHAAFAKELSAYKQGKGSVQFPLDAPMPYEIIRRMIAFRVAENSGKTAP